MDEGKENEEDAKDGRKETEEISSPGKGECGIERRKERHDHEVLDGEQDRGDKGAQESGEEKEDRPESISHKREDP